MIGWRWLAVDVAHSGVKGNMVLLAHEVNGFFAKHFYYFDKIRATRPAIRHSR